MSGRTTAIVVGGGPAGSLAALLLARAGFDVQLIEQHRFPRDKVCGECLSALGWDVLTRAGLAERLERLQPVRLTRTAIHPADGPSLDLPLPRPMWGLTRFQLDRAMLAAATDAGVLVRQPARCEGLSGGDRPTVTWRDLCTNRETTAVADWVVVADGKGALLPPRRSATGDLGIKAHFSSVDGPRDAIELFAASGCYGGLAAVEGGRWNAAFSLPAAVLRDSGGNVEAAFARVVSQNAALASRLKRAVRTCRWLTAPLPRFAVRGDWPTRIVPVGNAAAALEPIGGEGMGLALRSAELAARAVAQDTGTVELQGSYRDLWGRRRLACRAIARVLVNSALTDAVSDLVHAQPSLALAAMSWAGKAEGTGRPLQSVPQ